MLFMDSPLYFRPSGAAVRGALHFGELSAWPVSRLACSADERASLRSLSSATARLTHEARGTIRRALTRSGRRRRPIREAARALQALLAARAIAVVGAGDQPRRFRHRFVRQADSIRALFVLGAVAGREAGRS